MRVIPKASVRHTDRYKGPGGYWARKAVVAVKRLKGVSAIGWLHIRIPHGRTSAEHHHRFLTELLYFLSAGSLTLNGKKYKVSPETLVVLSPGDRHQVLALHGDVEFLAVKMPNFEGDKVL